MTTATTSTLLVRARWLRVVLDLHALTLAVAAFLLGWNAEVCDAAAGAVSCDRSWLRAVAWWAAGGVSTCVPLFLGRFVVEASRRLDEL